MSIRSVFQIRSHIIGLSKGLKDWKLVYFVPKFCDFRLDYGLPSSSLLNEILNVKLSGNGD